MDKVIIQEAIKGNTKAFKKIFDFYLPKMRPTALRYVHTEFEADDILQESFVKVFHNLSSFKHEGSFEGWIKRIVVNTALNNYKKNKNHYFNDQLDNIVEPLFEDESSDLIDEIEPSHLMKLIEELPDGYKMVFNLYVFDELSHKEIGEALNISDGTSRSQYSKAKKLLKKMMSKQHIDQKSSLYREDNKNGR